MGRMIRMCLNWKVLAGLALVAVGVGVYRPDLFGAALPILLLAACPLSMLWMMRSMNQGEGMGAQSTQTSYSSDDPAILRAQINMLAAEQEKVSERLARLSSSRRSIEDERRSASTPPDTV